MWTLIRLLLEKQSDLGPHCLQKCILKSQAIVVIGSLRVKLSYKKVPVGQFFFVIRGLENSLILTLHLNCL